MLVRGPNSKIPKPYDIVGALGCEYTLNEEWAQEIYVFTDEVGDKIILTLDAIDEFSLELIIGGQQTLFMRDCQLEYLHIPEKENLLQLKTNALFFDMWVWPRFKVDISS